MCPNRVRSRLRAVTAPHEQAHGATPVRLCLGRAPQARLKHRYSPFELIGRRAGEYGLNGFTGHSKLVKAMADPRISPAVEHPPVFSESLTEARVIQVAHVDEPRYGTVNHVIFEAAPLELKACFADSAIAAPEIGEAATDCQFNLIVG